MTIARDTAAASGQAAAHFADRLRFETDVVDVGTALAADPDAVLLLDVRSHRSYAHAHAVGAVSAPTAAITRDLLAAAGDRLVVVMCWGPGCNGAQHAALRVAELGVPVKEMIGGFEYWVREGFPVAGEGVGLGDGRYEREDAGLVALPQVPA